MTKDRANELIVKYIDVCRSDENLEAHVTYLAIPYEYENYAIVLTTIGECGRLPIAVYTDGDYFEAVRMHTINKKTQAQRAL